MKKVLATIFILLFAIGVNSQNTADNYIKNANLKVSLEDYYWAIADYTKAIEIDRYDGSVYNNRNTAKYFLGDKNGACKDAIKARKLGYNASELINLVCN